MHLEVNLAMLVRDVQNAWWKNIIDTLAYLKKGIWLNCPLQGKVIDTFYKLSNVTYFFKILI